MGVDINGSFEDLIKTVSFSLQPTRGELLHAMELMGETILERTARGVDYQGSPFKPYNTTLPYWYKGTKYESYDSFKKSLGRFGVDLLGADDPHMLGAFDLKVDGHSFKFGSGDYDAQTAPGTTVTLGIYQTKGQLAYWHNEGVGRLPERKFFAMSSEDKDRIYQDIAKRIRDRINRSLHGH